MQLSLTNEMIEKITCVSFGRYQDLRRKIEEANKMEITTERERIFNNQYLKDLNKALKAADEVHTMFLELLETCENEEE